MKSQEWANKNPWSQELNFNVAFQTGGGFGDMLHSAYCGSMLPRIKDFKRVFPKNKIALFVNSHDKDVAEQLWGTIHEIDEVCWRREETTFRQDVKTFFEMNRISTWTGEQIYEGNPWEMVYNGIRFPKKYIPVLSFLNQLGLAREDFITKPLLPYLTEEDIKWADDHMRSPDKPIIGISFFSSHPVIGGDAWNELINFILDKGFRIAFFGSPYEKELYEVDNNNSERPYKMRAWQGDQMGVFYSNLMKETHNNFIDMVGVATDIRKFLACFKKCAAHITVNSGPCNIPWIYQIPSLFIHIQTKQMNETYMNRKNGYFWGVTSGLNLNGTRIIIQETDRYRTGLTDIMWKQLCDETDFLDRMNVEKRR